MKKTICIIMLGLASSFAAQADVFAYLSTYGPWPLCVNGTLGGVPGILTGDCSWYKPGAETYALNIRTDNTSTDSYSYSVTVALQDGTTKTISSVAARDDDQTTGFTMVFDVAGQSPGGMHFGGRVTKVISIEISEHTKINQHRIVGSVVRGRP